MIGNLPRFIRESDIPKGYYATPDPYKNPEPSFLDLRALTAYAKEQKKNVRDLSYEEVRPFMVTSK